jgi:hypothetical protein
MGLLNDYGLYGGTSGRTSPRSRYFSGPPAGFQAPPTTTGGSAEPSGPVTRTFPERIILDDIVSGVTGAPPETPAALEMIGRAPGYVLGGPPAAIQTVGKAAGFDVFGLLGDIAQAIPFLPGLNRETGDWNWSLGGFLGQAAAGAGDVVSKPFELVQGGINAANAEAIRKALAADPNDDVEYTIPNLSFIMRKLGSTFGMEDPGKQETNAEFLARMSRLGWTPEEMSDIAAGRDAWTFADMNHRMSEDVWTDLGLGLMLDPLTYTPAVVAKFPQIARAASGAAVAIQSTDLARRTNLVGDLLSGSQAALRARQGAGLASTFVRDGVLPAAYQPIKMASQAIRAGASGAAQHATRWSVADAIMTSTRGFGRGFITPFRPAGAMVRHAFDVPGYVRGFGPIPAAERARAAEFGLRTPNRFTRGASGYASRATALRGTEVLFEQTTEGIDAVLGDEDGENTAVGGFTENLRELGHAMVSADPINSTLTGMLVAGFMYPGIPIVSEALGVGRRVAGPARNSIRGVWDDLTWRPIGADDIPNEAAFMDLFATGDFRSSRSARLAARKEVINKLGGMESVRRLWDAATTALVREHLIRDLPNEWRIRSIASASARAQASSLIFKRAREDLIRTGRLTDTDVMHAIMAMDEGTGGFDLAKQAARANGASSTSGGGMRWNGDLAARTWVRFQAASQPINQALVEKGIQVSTGVREYLPKEVLTDLRAALMITKTGKGNKATVTAGDVQRMLRDHPQLIALDPQGYWAQYAVMDPATPVKWSSVGRKLQNMEKSAPTWDEVMADVDAHEATAGPITGMGEEPLRAGSVALTEGRIRFSHAPPGEARVAVSRMNPELGEAPGTYREARAMRTNPAIAAYERSVGAILHDSGINVDQVHQTVGGWASDGKIFREPSLSITMGRNATLEETRLTAAMTARQAGQQETLFWVTGSRMADLDVKPNAALGRITNIPRRSYAKVEEALHRRYADGYTFDDTAGEAIVFVPDAPVRDLLPDLQATLDDVGVKGTTGAEPAYVEFLGTDDFDTILNGASDDVRVRRFTDSLDQALNDPDFDSTALANRLAGHANRTLLASTRTGGGGRDGVRHGTLTSEGLIRDGLRRTQAPDGSVIPGLETENLALRQQLQDLVRVKREALTRSQVLYKASDASFFDPLSPIRAEADAPILTRAESIQPSLPAGTVRYAPEGKNTVEVLREVPIDQVVWAQDTLQIANAKRLQSADLNQIEYGRGVLIDGRIVLKDGHHRLNESARRGEGVVKVWVGEARAAEGTVPPAGARSNETVELPINEEEGLVPNPIDADEFILHAFDAQMLTADEVLGRQVTPEMPLADLRAMASVDLDALIASENHSAAIKNLARSIKRSGLREPLEIRETPDGRRYLAEGHHRLLAMERLGMERAPVTAGLAELRVQQKFAQAEEQVLFNRTLDAELDELMPMLRYDKSTGALSPEDLAALTPAYNYLMRNFGGAYDLKVAPEMAFPITDVVPASLKVSSLLGEWVRQYGPVSKVNAMIDWALKPVDTGRQAQLARTAMYRQLIPRGATIKQVDSWVNEMSKMTGNFTIGPLRLKVFRDATALTPTWINKAAAASFPESVLKDVGADNFHLILDRSANRFIRDTMFPGLQGGKQAGGSRGRLQRLVAEGYYIFQTGDPTGKIRPRGQRRQIVGLRRAAEGKRLLAKTIYPIFRFMLDPRWHAMNRFEYNILSGVKDSIWRPERRSGQFSKGRNVAGSDPISDFGAVTTMADVDQLPPGAQRAANLNVDDALLDIESVGGGFLHNREAAGFIARIWQSRALDDIEDVVNQMPEMDAGLRDLMRLFPDEAPAPAAGMIRVYRGEGGPSKSRQGGRWYSASQELAGDYGTGQPLRYVDLTPEEAATFRSGNGDDPAFFEYRLSDEAAARGRLMDRRSIYDKINEFMYEMDMKGAKDTVTAEAIRQFGAQTAADLEPMLNQIALRHQQTFDAVTQMLQGNPARNNIERIMNSYWLYWPLSYQLKAGKWLFQVLTEGFAGQKTNFGGAAWATVMAQRHVEKLATDPQYQQAMEDHEGLFLAATMMVPITPFDLGVSLNRGIRGVGGHLGWWEEYKRAQDPVVFATWLAELGPLYSIQLAQQVYGETFGDRSGDTENERTGTPGTAVPTFDSTVPGGAPAPSFGP